MAKFLKNILSLAIVAIIILPTSAFAIGEEDEGENGETGESSFTITYDFNGGATFDGQSTYVEYSASVAPFLNEPVLIACFEYNNELDECHPLNVLKGKELAYVTVNGERHEVNRDESFMLNEDKTIIYYWNDIDLDDYVISDENGNTVTFDEETGHEYHLEVGIFSFSMTDEELAAAEVTREEYEAGKTMIIEAVGDQGTVVAFLEASVYEFSMCGEEPCICEDTDGEKVPCLNDARGPFTLRLKLTDEMKDYKTYKLMYVDTPNDGNGKITTEDAIACDIDGDYLVCTVPHFSGYAVLGSNGASVPDTGAMTNPHEAVSESLILAIILAAAFVSAGVFLIVSDFRRR